MMESSRRPQDDPAWLHGHPHEPNPAPPGDDASFVLSWPDAGLESGGGNCGECHRDTRRITVEALAHLPQTNIADCYIVSTGHGISGPFDFGGVRLIDFVTAYLPTEIDWEMLDVISGDGFGNRIWRHELLESTARPMLLATHLDGAFLTRDAGLVRLIVPNEVDDALRQVKWIARIEVDCHTE